MALVTGPIFEAGSAISNVVAIGQANDPFLIFTPPEWTPARLAFLISAEGDNFFPLYKDGVLWEIACVPNAALMLETARWPSTFYIRFLSGMVGIIENPVPQIERREFKLLMS